MRSYTKEAISDKFERVLKPDNLNKNKEVLKQTMDTVTKETMKAYFIGTLRAISFDVISTLECRPASHKEITIEVQDEMIDKIDKAIALKFKER